MQPRISVVLPTWNRGGRVGHAIRSIIDQSFEDWELVVIDDGSEDGTGRVVKDFAHPRIKYHKIEHQNNISRVRNIGNQLAQGEIIVVQDSDDLSFPDRLEWIDETFALFPSADIVYHGMYLTFPDPYIGGITRKVRHADAFSRDRLKKEQYIPGQIAYTKKHAMEVPYNEEVVLCDDYMFLLESAYQDKVFVPIHRNLYEYFASPDSINVKGEMDGRRRHDIMTMLRILRDKYGVDAHATLTKQVGGEVIEKEDI